MTLEADFDLATEPWIDVLYTDGSPRAVGFRQAMLDAHLITDLALAYPAAYGALYRVLAALALRVTGLDRSSGGAQWYRRRNNLFAIPFDADAVEKYFADHAEGFALYGPRGFFQDDRLRTDCKATSGINKLVFGRASGSARPWFAGKQGDRQQQPVPSEQAAVHLLMWAYYGSGGTVTTRSSGGVNTQTGCQAGPLRGTVGYHPLGPTLHTTLVAHLTPLTTEQTAGSPRPDLAPWEHDGHTDPTLPTPPPRGPVSLLAGRTRHAILLTPGNGGRTATDCVITWGARNPPKEERAKPGDHREPFPDPYLAYRRSAKTRAPSSAVEADGGRHLFRDLDVLLNSPDSRPPEQAKNTPTRPTVLHACEYLPDEVVETLRIRVVGVHQDRDKNVDRQWWTSTTPPLLAHTAQRDPEIAERVEQAVREADKAAWSLDRALAAAFADKPKDQEARALRQTRIAAQYWPRADTAFWHLYNTQTLPGAQPLMRVAALNAFDALTATLARSLSAGHRVAQARALLPLPRKDNDHG